MQAPEWVPLDPILCARLSALRRLGDPPLDDALARGAAASRWLEALEGTSPAPLPPGLEGLEGLALPGWADPARLARAARLFQRHAGPMAALLGSASLLECFACARGARDLYAARALPRDPRGRVGRTGQFVLAVLSPGAWADGRAPRALARVRVIHALTRYRLLASDPQRGTAAGDVPLCQEDQLGTLLAFGFSPLLHLQRMGIPVAEADLADSLHFWRVAGHLLGAPVQDLPEQPAQAASLAAAIRARNFAPSAEGRALTAAVLDAYAGVSRSARLHRGFLRWLRAVVGEATCDLLGVPGPPAARLGRSLARSTGRLGHHLGRLPALHPAIQAGLHLHARRMAHPEAART